MKKLLLVGLLAAPASTASGDDVPGVVYELVDGSGSSFDRFEASGASYFAGQLLIVDDMVNTLFVFDTAGRLSARLEASGFLDEQAKFEDIAYLEAQNTFFAVGSHSGWSEEWLRRFSVLYEFRVASGTIEEASVRRLDLTRAFERLGLWKPHGMKIEGLAVDPSDQYLFVGLREPVDRARVYAFPLEALRRGDPSLRPDVWVEFDAGFVENTPYCISALLWEPTLQGLLVLLHITAHPDDEHGGMLTLSSRGQCVRVSLLSLTRGEAGANAIGPELFDDLGSIRAEELTLAGRYYGLDALYFTRLADYGYSTIALWVPGAYRILANLLSLARRPTGP